MAGGVTIALNTFSTREELKYQLEMADVALMIMEAKVASKNFVDDVFEICPALTGSTPGALFSEEFPFLRRVVCIDKGYERPGLQEWDDFMAGGRTIADSLVARTSAATNPVDQGVIFFSSGSTAQPKAILQTHRAATLQCWRFGNIFEVDSNTRSLPANGFFFSGNFAQAIGTLSRGGCMVLWWITIRRRRATAEGCHAGVGQGLKRARSFEV